MEYNENWILLFLLEHVFLFLVWIGFVVPVKQRLAKLEKATATLSMAAKDALEQTLASTATQFDDSAGSLLEAMREAYNDPDNADAESREQLKEIIESLEESRLEIGKICGN